MNEITISKEKAYILDFGNGEKVIAVESYIPTMIFAYKMIGKALVKATPLNNVVGQEYNKPMEKETVTFEVTHLDGEVVKHAFDFSKKDEVRDFYKTFMERNLIAGWEIIQ